MNSIAKVIVIFLSAMLVFSMLAGCSDNSSMTYTFSVDNGDSIKVSLDTTDNYSMSSDLPFSISCNGETLSQGTFIQGDAFEQYKSVAMSDKNARVIDSGIKGGNDYIFWCYNGAEYNYAIMINDSNTGIVLGNAISEESARECFDRLSVYAE